MVCSNVLDRRVAALKRFSGAKVGSELYLAPFQASISHRLVQIFLIFLGLYLLAMFITVVVKKQNYGLKEFSSFKFSGNIFSHDESTLQDLKLCSVRFTLRGCESYSTVLPDCDGFNLTLPLLRFDGMELTFSATNYSQVSYMLFQILGSRDSWQTSGVVASSDTRLALTDIRFLKNRVPYRQEFLLDYSPRLPFLVYGLSHFLLWGLICIQIGVCGALHRSALAKRLCIFLLAVSCIVSAISSACLLAAGGLAREALAPALGALVCGAQSAVLLVSEKHLLHANVLVGLAALALRIAIDAVAFNDAEYVLVDPPVLPLGFLAVGGALLAARRRWLLATLSALAQDRALYDKLWRTVTTEDGRALDVLDRRVRSLPRSCAPADGRPRQLNRRIRARRTDADRSISSVVSRVFQPDDGPLDSTDLGAARGSLTGEPDPASPVRSLDQLYVQASAAVYYMRSHCAAWAQECNGTLEIRGDSDASNVGSAVADGAAALGVSVRAQPEWPMSELVAGWVRRGYLKHPARAVEKLLGCYSGDASRLLDVCRARLLFCTAADILRCVETIRAAAPFVQIVGAKSSLCVGQAFGPMGGYRVLIPIRSDSRSELWMLFADCNCAHNLLDSLSPSIGFIAMVCSFRKCCPEHLIFCFGPCRLSFSTCGLIIQTLETLV